MHSIIENYRVFFGSPLGTGNPVSFHLVGFILSCLFRLFFYQVTTLEKKVQISVNILSIFHLKNWFYYCYFILTRSQLTIQLAINTMGSIVVCGKVVKTERQLRNSLTPRRHNFNLSITQNIIDFRSSAPNLGNPIFPLVTIKRGSQEPFYSFIGTTPDRKDPKSKYQQICIVFNSSNLHFI